MEKFSLKGRIDSANAGRLEKELEAYRQKSGAGILELDASGLEYISSAGLRVLLRLIRSGAQIRMTEV